MRVDLTYLVVDVGVQADLVSHDRVVSVIRSAGGRVVDLEGFGSYEAAVVGGVFGFASDAVEAAVHLVRWVHDRGGASGSDPGWVRAVLGACDADPDPLGEGSPALVWARDLLEDAANAANEVLVTSSAAVLVDPVLPHDATLIDRGTRSVAGQGTERVYELRLDDAEVAAPQAMEWAQRAAPGPVVGRDAEMSSLEATWREALRHGRRIVMLTGEAGIGKTAVTATLAMLVQARGGIVLYGRWDQDGNRPYQAIREALWVYADSCPVDRLRSDIGDRLEDVGRLLPEMSTRLGGGVDAPEIADPERDRLAMFDGIETWLGRIAARRPVLLVLDDLQWADPSSLLLLEQVLFPPADVPLLTVCTGRAGEAVEPAVTALLTATDSGDDQILRIALDGLERADVAQLVVRALGPPVAWGEELEEVTNRLARDTAGNPMFVQEVLRGLPRPCGLDVLQEVVRTLPSRLADLVWWRLAQLPGETTHLLARASVIGAQFDVELLADLDATAAVTIQAPLERAQRAGLLHVEPDGDCYTFAHDVIRQSLYDDIPLERARALHRRLADTLANRVATGDDVRPDQVAHHYLRTLDPSCLDITVHWVRLAAQAAARRTAFETSVQLLTAAANAYDRLGPAGGADQAVGCQLRLELAGAQDRASQWTERDRSLLVAAAQARKLGRDDLLTQAAVALGGLTPPVAPPDDAVSGLLSEALEQLDDDLQSRALLQARHVHMQQMKTPYRERRHRLDQALAVTAEIDDSELRAAVLTARAHSLDGPDDVEERLAIGAEVETLGRQISKPEILLDGARLRLPPLLTLGRHQEARQLAARFAELAQQVGHPGYLSVASQLDIFWAEMQGDYDTGEAVADDLHRQLTKAGHPDGDLVHFSAIFGLRRLRGGLESVRPELHKLQETIPVPSLWWALTAYLDAATGHEDGVKAELAVRKPQAFIEGIDRNVLWLTIMISCSTAAATVRNTRWARVLLRTLSPYTGRQCVFGYSAYAGAIDHHLGTLQVAIERYENAIALLRGAMEQEEKLGARPYVALSAVWLAHALTRRGRAGDDQLAAKATERAAAIAQDLGLRNLPRFDDR